MLNTETINKLLNINESYKAPETMMEKIMNNSEREKLFADFLSYEKDLSYEWFQNYFEEEQKEKARFYAILY